MFKRFLSLLVAGLALIALALTLAPAEVAQAQVNRGTNWSATFYNSTNFSGTPVAQNIIYPNGLNFIWQSVPTQGDNVTPVPGVQADNFSVIFTTTENFAQAGTYNFTGRVDDRLTVFIDGIQVYSDPDPGPTDFSFNFNLTAGQHTIRLDFIEFAQSAELTFQWQFGQGAGQPAVTPTPSGPQGQVVTVRGLSLRTGPYLGASFIAVLRPNINYPVLARNMDEGGPFTWYRVQAGERVGWTSGRYLSVTNADQVPFEATVFEQIDDAPDISVVGATRAVMNFRRRPSIRSERIGQIPWGAQVSILGRTIQAGESFWYHVRYGEQVGWIFADFVGIQSGFLEIVPIR